MLGMFLHLKIITNSTEMAGSDSEQPWALQSALLRPGAQNLQNHVMHDFISTKRQKFKSENRFSLRRSGRSEKEIKGQKRKLKVRKGPISSFICFDSS